MSRIGPGHTPPERCGCGFASGLVAAVSARGATQGARNVLLDAGKADRTSNSVHRRLGYRPAQEAPSVDFG